MTNKMTQSRRLADIETLRRMQRIQAEQALVLARAAEAQQAIEMTRAERDVDTADAAWHAYVSTGPIDPDQLRRLAASLGAAKSALDRAVDAHKAAVESSCNREADWQFCNANVFATEKVRDGVRAECRRNEGMRTQTQLEDRVASRWARS